jgi:hypothetical protein
MPRASWKGFLRLSLVSCPIVFFGLNSYPQALGRARISPRNFPRPRRAARFSLYTLHWRRRRSVRPGRLFWALAELAIEFLEDVLPFALAGSLAGERAIEGRLECRSRGGRASLAIETTGGPGRAQ